MVMLWLLVLVLHPQQPVVRLPTKSAAHYAAIAEQLKENMGKIDAGAKPAIAVPP